MSIPYFPVKGFVQDMELPEGYPLEHNNLIQSSQEGMNASSTTPNLLQVIDDDITRQVGQSHLQSHITDSPRMKTTESVTLAVASQGNITRVIDSTRSDLGQTMNRIKTLALSIDMGDAPPSRPDHITHHSTRG